MALRAAAQRWPPGGDRRLKCDAWRRSRVGGSWNGTAKKSVPTEGLEGGGGNPAPSPPPGRPAYAQPLSLERQVPASMAFVTDSNHPQPLLQPPPTACLTASGAASEASSLSNASHWGRPSWRGGGQRHGPGTVLGAGVAVLGGCPGVHWKGGGGIAPPPGRPAYAQPLSPRRQVMGFCCVKKKNSGRLWRQTCVGVLLARRRVSPPPPLRPPSGCAAVGQPERKRDIGGSIPGAY